MLHPEACWGGLPARIQTTNIYNLETGKFVTNTRHFQNKPLAGVILQVTFGREIIWREYFKTLFGRKISKTFRQEQFQKLIGGNILAKKNLRDFFFFTLKTPQNTPFFK